MSNKKKKVSKKPREEWFYASTDGETTSLEISVNSQTGTISFVQPMKDTYAEISHKKEDNTDKVIQRTYQDVDKLGSNINDTLFNCDKLLFIDTNQKELSGIHLSVTAITILRENTIFPFAFIARTAKEKFEERKFWYYALRCLIAKGFISLHEKIHIYVDSHLGSITGINSRSEPMCENIFLPNNITLHYASADKGKEYNANKAFCETDKIATEVRDKLLPKLPQMTGNTPLQEHVYFIGEGGKLQPIPLNLLYSLPPWS